MNETQGITQNTYRIRAVERAIAILKAFSTSAPELGVTDIARRLDIHKSTVHRLLTTLERQGVVVQNPGTGRYSLGFLLVELGALAISGMEVRQIARPHLEEMHRACGETVHLAILDEGEVVYIDKIESMRRVRMYSQVGRRAPAHCTGLGKVLLAALPPAMLDQMIQRRGLRRYTESTITSPGDLRDHLAVIRQRGYAIDSGEHEELIRCAAAAVRDRTGQVIAAVSIATVGVEVKSPRFKEYVDLVVRCADSISEAIGYRRAQPAIGGVADANWYVRGG